ncbi:MAG: STAS domain-containing protein [bacterium]
MDFNTYTASDGAVTVIEIPDQFDYSISESFRVHLKSLVEEGRFKFVIDLSQNKYIDSSGLGSLVSRISLIRSNGGDIRLAAPSETVVNVLNLTHLNKILKCFDDVHSAVVSYESS